MTADPFHRAFGEAVKEMRKELMMSQETAAAEAGIDRCYLSELELGKHSPTLGCIVRLAWVFGTTPSDLIRQAEKQINGNRKRNR